MSKKGNIYVLFWKVLCSRHGTTASDSESESHAKRSTFRTRNSNVCRVQRGTQISYRLRFMRELGLRSVSESESESFKFAIGRSWIGIGLEPRQPECGFADMGSCKVETGVFVAVLRWLSRTLRLNGRLHRKQGGYICAAWLKKICIQLFNCRPLTSLGMLQGSSS